MPKRKKNTVEKKHNKEIDNTNISDSEHGDYSPGDDGEVSSEGYSQEDNTQTHSNLEESKEQHIILKVSPAKRREEMKNYLSVFGYDPQRTVITVQKASLFGKRRTPPQGIAPKKGAVKGVPATLTVVGRTHDPDVLNTIHKPQPSKHGHSEAYMGFYSHKSLGKAPHELIPLDFTPTHFEYPDEWNKKLGGASYLLTLNVSATNAKNKNALMRKLYRLSKHHDTQEAWDWIQELKSDETNSTSAPKSKKSKTQDQSTQTD